METTTIPEEVPVEVEEGLMAVRDSGAANMFDRHGVIRIAVDLGFDETASWMRNKANRSSYIAWLRGRQE